MGYATVRLCQGGGGFEALPQPRRSLDLARLRVRLESSGVSVVDARVMLIARMRHGVTIAQDGRVLIKGRDPDEAEALLAELRPWLEEAAVSPRR